MADATSGATDDSFVLKLRKAVIEAGQLAGALMALLGLGSVFINFMIVTDGWSVLLSLAAHLPEWVLNALVWLGGAWNAIITSYQRIVHPMAQYVASLISLRLEPWQIDLLFVFTFSAFSASGPILSAHTRFLDKPDGRHRVRSFVVLLLAWPFRIIVDAGLIMVRVIDRVFEILTFGNLRPIHWVYWKLPPPDMDMFFIRFVCNALVLASAFGINWIYVLYQSTLGG